MAFKLLDRASQSVSGSPGTGNITLGAPVSGYQSFSTAGMNNGDTTPYIVSDVNNTWEYGVATYTSTGGGTLARTPTMTSAGNNSPLSLTSKAVVSATVRAEDIKLSTTLAGLNDVQVTPGSGINGYALTYNNSLGAWTATALGGAYTLQVLNNGASVDTAAIALNFINATSITTSAHEVTITLPTGSGGSSTLSGLSDVNVTEGSGINGYTLNWNNATGKWIATAPVVPNSFSLAVTNNGTSVETAATTLNFVNATSITTSSHDVTITLPTGGGGGGTALHWELGPLAPPNPSWFDTSGSAATTTMTAITSVGTTISAARASGDHLCFGRRDCTGWTTPWTVTCRLAPSANLYINYNAIGMMVEDTSGKFLLFIAQGNNGAMKISLNEFSSNTSYNSNIGSDEGFNFPTWFQVSYDGTNLTFGFSYDGQQYSTASVSATGYLSNVKYVGIGGDNNFTASEYFTPATWNVTCTYYSDPDYPASGHTVG